MKRIIYVGTLTALLAACATAPQHSDQIDRARAATETLAAEPMAQQAATDDLAAARNNLQQAETALQNKQPMTEVDHLAYLAERHAQTGQARVATAQAQAQVNNASADRNRVLLEARAREAQNAKDQLAAAQQQLADLKAKQTDRGMVVTLGDVLFDTGRATLKPGGIAVLERLAAYMQSNPQTRLVVEGHTDSTGSQATNDELSQRRADTVASALIQRGVSAANLQAVGKGPTLPVASNATAEGRQQNRRVEIIFSDHDGRFAGGNSGDPAMR